MRRARQNPVSHRPAGRRARRILYNRGCLADDASDNTGRLAGAVRQALAEAQESLAAVSTPMEFRDFVETDVGPMVLKADGEIERKETAPVEAEAVLGRSPAEYEAEPPHAGRVKRSIAGVGFASQAPRCARR